MSTDDKRWLDDRKNVDRLFYGLCAACLLVSATDLFYHKHGHFSVEALWGFHGFYGFAVFTFVVLVGKQLRRVLMRGEDYYAPEREPTPGGEGGGHD